MGGRQCQNRTGPYWTAGPATVKQPATRSARWHAAEGANLLFSSILRVLCAEGAPFGICVEQIAGPPSQETKRVAVRSASPSTNDGLMAVGAPWQPFLRFFL
ncbi:hypothetical protein EYF80_000118 [Liparis tanakae]|uniref:Uncharacterized protein n=1 Tax=Liparis tanakae TaxID=230148 RepID=A0A4Z2JGY4_9TELE|nr:hypothetical protein EYF80_000118 [Liparis tanakae]